MASGCTIHCHAQGKQWPRVSAIRIGMKSRDMSGSKSHQVQKHNIDQVRRMHLKTKSTRKET